MSPRNQSLREGNALKLALFGANCSSGRTYVNAPNRWVASWENNVKLAQQADDAGIEAMISIARWKGYGGETNPNGATWECITWSCGLLAATRRINVFATMHVSLNHPVIVAKQMATADHMGGGRFGVNVVCGSHEDEFDMFGVDLGDHDAGYARGDEWWTIINRIWDGQGPFDFEGEFYQLHGVEGQPAPYNGEAPIMMNAGTSPAGRSFAIRNSNMHFDGVKTPEESAERVTETKRQARVLGREIQVWTPLGVVCRPTQREADQFMEYLVEHIDRGAVGKLEQYTEANGRRADRPSGSRPFERRVLARGAWCVIGDPDAVANQLAELHAIGYDGFAINFFNYLDELPFFAQEVLPRLERLGVRGKTPATVSTS